VLALFAAACGGDKAGVRGNGGGGSGSGGADNGTTTSTSTGALCGAPTYLGGDACASCSADHCCGERTACAANPECAATMTCTATCDPSDHACFQACYAKTGQTMPPGSAELRACELANCGSECPFGELVCGGAAAVDPTCDSCSVANCCDVITARNGDLDFFALVECLEPCPSSSDPASCNKACIDAHPSGRKNADLVSSCGVTNCKSQCQFDCAGPATIATGACDDCINQKCCAEGIGCGTDSACSEVLVPCLLACKFGDQACEAACAALEPASVGNAGTYFTCALNQCKDECFQPIVAAQVQCGAVGAFDDPACASCVETSCCTPALACADDPDCYALLFCVEQCTDATCAAACKSAHASAASGYAALDACRTSTCASACSF
jgi:hypothetical protein